MKFYTTMPAALKPFFKQSLQDYATALNKNEMGKAWHHLEKAHVIGQRYPYHHSLVHWKMLVFGCRIKNVKEVIGQLPRLMVGGIKSFVGTIPVGNTGGANVPLMQSMPIQQEIREIFEKAGVALL